MNPYILAAMAALGIGGGLAGLAWGWRLSTWQERWRDAHPNGRMFPLGQGWLLIPECRIVDDEDTNSNTYGYLWPRP